MLSLYALLLWSKSILNKTEQEGKSKDIFGLFLKKQYSQNANVAIIVHTTCNVGQESYVLLLWCFVIFESLTLYTTIQMFVVRFDVFERSLYCSPRMHLFD